MKKVLIIVLSSDFHPYDKMIETSMRTWDSIEVPGVETVFVCGQSTKTSTDKIIYLTVDNDLFSMGRKNLLALEGALANKEFDYIARVNASCYVNKAELIKYVQELPGTGVFAGVVAKGQHGFDYCWGGTQFVISKDVVQKIVDNKEKYHHEYMEDESVSLLVSQLGIPFTKGIRSCSIDKSGDGWLCISYCEQSLAFFDFRALKDLGHIFYRVKQDGHREVDEYIMNELFKVLN